MPEVNNTEVKVEQSGAPQFVLPKRRGYIKYIAIPIVVIVVLACAWVAYAFFSQPAAPVVAPVAPAAEQSEAQNIPSGTRYYVSYDGNKNEVAGIYKYSPDSSKIDEKIGDIGGKGLSILGKYLMPYSYIVRNSESKLQILDATSAKLEPLFEVPQLASVGGVAISADAQWLAYILNYEGDNSNYAEVWLYNLETKEQKQLGKKTELQIYTGLSIVGWRDNDKELIASARGGDGGGIWGDLYHVSVSTGQVDKISPEAVKGQSGFITGKISPDKNKWLFEFCEKSDTAVNDKEGALGLNACASGTELRTYDFETKEIKTVYQNLRYDNNVDKSLLRTFMDFMWQDDNIIIAATPGALLSIPVGNPDKTKEEIIYDGSEPQKFRENYIGLVDVSENYIVYLREELWYVFDRGSKKIVNLNPKGRGQGIYFWLD